MAKKIWLVGIGMGESGYLDHWRMEHLKEL